MIVRTVKEFTSVCNEGLPENPVPMTKEEIVFLREMVNSEFDELEASLSQEDPVKKVVEQYDAIVDMLVYLADGCVKKAFNIDDVFSVVHAANMRKIIDGKVIKNERGKVLKPEGWYGPEEEMGKVIEGHLNQGSWN